MASFVDFTGESRDSTFVQRRLCAALRPQQDHPLLVRSLAPFPPASSRPSSEELERRHLQQQDLRQQHPPATHLSQGFPSAAAAGAESAAAGDNEPTRARANGATPDDVEALPIEGISFVRNMSAILLR